MMLRPLLAPWRAAVCAVACSVVSLAAHAACTEDLVNAAPERGAKGAASRFAPTSAEAASADALDPQAQLQLIAREAARRSAQVGASRLLAEAAAYDLDEIRGATQPQITANGSIGPSFARYGSDTLRKGNQITGTLNATGILYDGGRLNHMSDFRRELAGAARFGMQATREQVVLEAVTTALERNRYRTQAKVYQQYARKMGCLVEALDQIVREDRGRASELLQARKTQAQAELARDGALAQSRQTEARLRKLIGDQVTVGDGLGGPLSQVMDTGEILRLLEQNAELQQLRLQANAAEQYAQAVEAGQKPQVNWMAMTTGGSQAQVANVAVQAGLSVSYTLFNGNADKASALAASKRASAARQQYDELLNTRSARAYEVQEAASSAFDRARRYVEVLKDSERVRMATFQQWSQLGRRSLFDVMSAEGDHFNLRVMYVNALHDGYQANAQLRSIGGGLVQWLGAADER
jgi:adhesin transport system outer membrane protein